MKNLLSVLSLLSFSISSLLLASGCTDDGKIDHDSLDNAAEQTGETIENAASEATEAVKDAAESAGDSIEKATD